jgi:hypothetical protein
MCHFWSTLVCIDPIAGVIFVIFVAFRREFIGPQARQSPSSVFRHLKSGYVVFIWNPADQLCSPPQLRHTMLSQELGNNSDLSQRTVTAICFFAFFALLYHHC